MGGRTGVAHRRVGDLVDVRVRVVALGHQALELVR